MRYSFLTSLVPCSLLPAFVAAGTSKNSQEDLVAVAMEPLPQVLLPEVLLPQVLVLVAVAMVAQVLVLVRVVSPKLPIMMQPMVMDHCQICKNY